jgi:hypothetical protein
MARVGLLRSSLPKIKTSSQRDTESQRTGGGTAVLMFKLGVIHGWIGYTNQDQIRSL